MKRFSLFSLFTATILSVSLSYAASEWGGLGRPQGYTVEIGGATYLFKPSGIKDKYFKFSLIPGWPKEYSAAWKRCEEAFYEKRGDEFVLTDKF